MFTGRRSDAYNGTSFEGDVVVFENRPFSIDNGQVAGETVVEAVFGYSGAIVGQATGATVGYGTGSSTLVILLWPNTLPGSRGEGGKLDRRRDVPAELSVCS